MSRTLLDRNLLSLAGTDPLLAARVGRAEESRLARFPLSKTGKPVLAVEIEGRLKALHSLFDPEKEGRRFPETFPPDGFFFFLGFGCAYHILPFLDRPNITRIVVVEKDLGLFKSVLSAVDLRVLLLDPRVKILIDPTPAELHDFILSNYFPAIAGDLRTVTLRARADMEEDFFRDRMRVIGESLGALSDDFTVQTQFGKKWFANTLSNLEAAEKSVTVPAPKRRAIVTGAGPSLEDGIPRIRELRKESLLIATDTSLPALLAADLVPDIVISIDCQHITYNHFLQGYPKEVPLVLDLASPPVVTKLAPKVAFFTSGHPFSGYVNRNWRRFPVIDTSGGNVSGAAVSLADRLGAGQILLFGADFSYPQGKSYARGAYIYPYFRCRETRFSSIESLFVHFLFRNRNMEKRWSDGELRYTTKPMMGYKERLELASAGLSAELVPVPGRGEPILTARRTAAGPQGPMIFSPGPAAGSWKEMLAAYGAALRALPKPKAPITSYIFSLSQEERNLIATLLPATAVFVKALRAEKLHAPELLERSLLWTLETTDKFLSGVQDGPVADE